MVAMTDGNVGFVPEEMHASKIEARIGGDVLLNSFRPTTMAQRALSSISSTD